MVIRDHFFERISFVTMMILAVRHVRLDLGMLFVWLNKCLFTFQLVIVHNFVKMLYLFI